MINETIILSRTSRGAYILQALEQHTLNGDAYVLWNDAYKICCRSTKKTYQTFVDDVKFLIDTHSLCREGSRLYLAKTLRYEEYVSQHLAFVLRNNEVKPSIHVPKELNVCGIQLTEEQRNAVVSALSHQVSLVLGGAGSGKTTLIRAMVSCIGSEHLCLLAAPTGKAARNLAARTDMETLTVHSALGMTPDDDFLQPVRWDLTKLIVIDEASMVTLEMLAGLFNKMSHGCRLVLLGDPNQLLSVGSGNVIPDLLSLGIPCVKLETNHRQARASEALRHNVTEFNRIHAITDLKFDESFTFNEMCDSDVMYQLVEDAVQAYCAGESIQVLSPYNKSTELSVDKLNAVIRNRVNPAAPNKPELSTRDIVFRDGDRVIITENNYELNCSNGDVGILRITDISDPDWPVYHVQLSDGRRPEWMTNNGLHHMRHAYALTVHKSQGSEYDRILFPVSHSAMNMMYRNLLYTAFSRGKRQVILYGSGNALSSALQKTANVRKSMLVSKTHFRQMKCA